MNISQMSLEQKILQTVIILLEKGKKPTCKPGAAFFFGQIITQADEAGISELKRYVEEIYRDAEIPPLITSDFENGCGSMVKGLTPLPYMMGLGATGDADLAYDYGKATALEARSVGANWTFSPVADLNLNPRNPLVNVRALTDNSDLACEMLPQIVKGMQDWGLAACAKHFPGDGVDYRDQHITTTVNSLSLSDWYESYGRVFKSLIDGGVLSVMAGHISLPDYPQQPDRKFGTALPATLNHELITGLLKKKLGFKGAVITDALGMGGFTGWYPTREQSEIEAFKAGCDMLLWPSKSYVENMKNAVLSGEITKERLDDAVERILSLKRKIGLYDINYQLFRQLLPEEKQFVENVQRRCAEKSITLVRDWNGIFPINKQRYSKIGIIPVLEYQPAMQDARALKTAFEERGFTVDFFERGMFTPQERKNFYEKNDIVIYALFSRPFRPMGFLDYTGDNAAMIAAHLAPDGAENKVIVASFGSPYFGKQYFERTPCYVNAYSMLECAAKAFVRAACGETEFTGKTPVGFTE